MSSHLLIFHDNQSLGISIKLSFRFTLVAQTVQHLPTMHETQIRSLGGEDLLEMEIATHSSTLAWRIPRMEEPGGLQSMVSQRVRHDWATSLHSWVPMFIVMDKCKWFEGKGWWDIRLSEREKGRRKGERRKQRNREREMEGREQGRKEGGQKQRTPVYPKHLFIPNHFFFKFSIS